MNKKELEEQELELRNGLNGITITTKLFGFLIRWKAHFFPIGLMDKQSLIFHKMTLDPAIYTAVDTKDIISLQHKTVVDNAKLCAEVMAITILGGRGWKYWLFKRWLTNHFYWNISSQQLLHFANELYRMNDYKGFITSMALMSVKTSPKATAIEDSKATME